MEHKRVALVLSGGGSRAALQVGALRALMERGFKPDFLVGVSAGALNAIFLAGNGWGRDQMELLGKLWKGTRRQDVYPGGRAAMIWRAVRGAPSLFPNQSFQRFLERSIPPDLGTFGDLGNPYAYVLTTRLDTGEIRVLGDDPKDRLLDALIATTAIPPLHPPWKVDGEWLIDGGVANNIPVPQALERGADEVWALHTVSLTNRETFRTDLFGNAARMMRFSAIKEAQDMSELARQSGGRYIALSGFENVLTWDFGHAAEMIEEGYRQAQAQLEGRT